MALCFFGLNRSLKWTGGSISRAVLAPFAESIGAGKLHAADIFFHTFDLRASRANVRAGERVGTAMGTPAEEAAFFSAAAEEASVAASLPVGAVQLRAFCVSDERAYYEPDCIAIFSNCMRGGIRNVFDGRYLLTEA